MMKWQDQIFLPTDATNGFTKVGSICFGLTLGLLRSFFQTFKKNFNHCLVV